MRLCDAYGRINFGTFTLPLYEMPPYVEDIREIDKNNGRITITIGEFLKPVAEIHIPIKD